VSLTATVYIDWHCVKISHICLIDHSIFQVQVIPDPGRRLCNFHVTLVLFCGTGHECCSTLPVLFTTSCWKGKELRESAVGSEGMLSPDSHSHRVCQVTGICALNDHPTRLTSKKCIWTSLFTLQVACIGHL